MERHVKERLIGAAVLVAIAVILIPELLSGPERNDTATTQRDTQGIKTYQFDLEHRRSTAAPEPTAAPPSEQPPPPLEAPRPAALQPPPQQTQPTTAAPAGQKQHAESERPVAAPAVIAPERTRVAAAQSPRSALPPPSVTPEPTRRKGWAVQLGSFADADRAQKLVELMQSEGYQAYVVPLTRTDGKVLQRVRIGPYPDEAAADVVMKELGDSARGAAIVPER